MPVSTFDAPSAHRWFAVTLNNVAWDLVEAPTRSDEESERMLHAAHAALYHWSEVGAAVNRQRALCLLATAYCVADRPEPAILYADQCQAVSRTEPDGQTAFDRATAKGVAALAYGLAGRSAAAVRLHAEANEIQLADAEERQLFQRLYPAPRPA